VTRVATLRELREEGCPLSTQRARHRQRRLLALLRPKHPAVRGQALAGVACRRRQKKYESPQSTPVAAAQPHASGPSSCGRPPVHSVPRPPRQLVAYGSTTKYRPVNRSKASGNAAKRPTQAVYFFCTTATKLTMTATVKAMDTQRWIYRTHLFQFNGTSSIVLRSTSIHDS
jgi:hypothetical protein